MENNRFCGWTSAGDLLEPELRLLHIEPPLEKAHLTRFYSGKGDQASRRDRGTVRLHGDVLEQQLIGSAGRLTGRGAP